MKRECLGNACPRCGGGLANFSPSGEGDAACDQCGVSWAAPEQTMAYPGNNGGRYGGCSIGGYSIAYVGDQGMNSHGYPWEVAKEVRVGDESKLQILGGSSSWKGCLRALATGEVS